MRALSLTQPWAQLVALGAKQIETRSWYHAHRGPLAIHAAKGFPKWAQAKCECEPFRAALGQAAEYVFGDLPLGYIVATCQLVDVVRIEPHTSDWHWNGPPGSSHHFYLTERERAFGDYTPGRWAWLLYDVQPLAQPIPARGALGMWYWDPTAVQP